MQCLMAAIIGGNCGRTRRFLVRFQYVHTPYLLFWRVSHFLVYTKGFLAKVFRHLSNGKNLAAIRVSQQVLQGSHPAPSADLRCLRDTHLESATIASSAPRPRQRLSPLCVSNQLLVKSVSGWRLLWIYNWGNGGRPAAAPGQSPTAGWVNLPNRRDRGKFTA